MAGLRLSLQKVISFVARFSLTDSAHLVVACVKRSLIGIEDERSAASTMYFRAPRVPSPTLPTTEFPRFEATLRPPVPQTQKH